MNTTALAVLLAGFNDELEKIAANPLVTKPAAPPQPLAGATFDPRGNISPLGLRGAGATMSPVTRTPGGLMGTLRDAWSNATSGKALQRTAISDAAGTSPQRSLIR